MTATIALYDPTAPLGEAAAQASTRKTGLSGIVVGFIDNAKPNFDVLVEDLADLFVSRHGAAGAIKLQKRSPAVAAPDQYYEQLAQQCGVVITGSGD
jgi:hypothetical protein